MKKLLFILAVALLGISFSGCEKDCELTPKDGFTIMGYDENCYYYDNAEFGGGGGSTKGKIKIVSESENPYTLYIDDSHYGTISGNSYKTVEVTAGNSYEVRVLQQSGYVLYPSEYTWNIYVQAGYIHTCTFPTKNNLSDEEIK